MAAKHEEQWVKMEEEVDATFWKVFSETSLIVSVRLLPWCISTAANPGALATNYLSEALATTVQWRAEVPMATIAPESGDPQDWVSKNSPLHQTRNPPLPILPFQTFPSLAPPVGHSFVRLLINSQHTNWIAPAVMPLMINLVRGFMLKQLKLKSAVGSAHHRTMKNHLKHHLRHVALACVSLGAQKWGQHWLQWWWFHPRWIEGEMQLSLIWNWPQRIVSLVQIWRR